MYNSLAYIAQNERDVQINIYIDILLFLESEIPFMYTHNINLGRNKKYAWKYYGRKKWPH